MVKPIDAFSSDSYSQQVGNEYIWNVVYASPKLYGSPFHFETGDQLKMVITVTNRTTISSVDCDTIYGNIYNNSATNQTWNLLFKDFLVGAYNKSVGIYPNAMALIELGIGIIPHNESAVNYSLFYILAFLGNYQWISGPHGYDGQAILTGNVTEPGDIKMEFKYNENGVLQSCKFYNATGSSWELFYHTELNLPPISGFIFIPAIMTIGIFILVYIHLSKEKRIIIRNS
ncbi:MAG: hypothetical protein ACTSYB_19130 [Candidatus Helarchaeota archaeon]